MKTFNGINTQKLHIIFIHKLNYDYLFKSFLILVVLISGVLGEEDNAKLASDLYTGDCDAILLNESYRDLIKETYSNFDSKTKVLWQTKLVEKVENTASDINVTKKPFVCYISGVDSRGGVNENSRSDVNLLVTVNPNNGQILMTSIPRDYYVKLANCGEKDKLTHSALYGGTDNSVKTIEDFLDINIDFYARVDFQSVIQLVDALGGIDIYSDKAFIPYTDHGIKIPEGNVHMNGRMALAFARERYTYKSGDQHRTENQQAVLQAIIKKAVSIFLPSHIALMYLEFNSILSSSGIQYHNLVLGIEYPPVWITPSPFKNDFWKSHLM